MTALHRLTQRVRPLVGATLAPMRRLRGAALARSVESSRRTTGWVSVIMPVRDVAPYIDEAVASVLSQDYWRVELFVIDDASTDGTGERLAAWQERDPRVRVLRAEVGDPNAARNLAIADAHGEYLTFLDGDDVLLAGAYRDLVGSLEASGSDFAVAAYDRLDRGRRTAAAFWIYEAHHLERQGAELESVPEIMVNAVQWSKVYRRSFWDRAGLSFPEGGHFQDQVLSAAAYARTHAFDVLRRATVAWRIRDDRSSMTQQVDRPGQIRDRFRTSREALDILSAEAGPELARERLVQYLSNDIAILASQLPLLDEDGWHELRTGLESLAPSFDERAVWDRVPAEFKVLYHFVIDGDEERARHYLERGGNDILRHELVHVEGEPHIALPFWDEREVLMPLDRFRAAPRELRAFQERQGV